MEVEIPGGIAVMREKLTVGGRELEDEYAGPARASFQKMIRNAQAQLTWATAVKEAEEAAKEAGVDAPPRPPSPDPEPLTSEESKAAWGANYAMVISRLVSWTLPGPIPTMETIRDLDGDVWDLLHAAALTLRKANQPPVVTPDSVEDRGSPFGSSTGSEEPSSPVEDASTIPETEESAPSGPSTSTDSASA
jgi:hypothetical protein